MFLLAALLAATPVVLKAARIFDANSGAVVRAGLGDVDLGDATLLPGLIDAHTHLTAESGPSWYRDTMDLLLRSAPEQAQYAAEYARRTLDAGFTTVRDLGAYELIDIGLHNAIESGAVPGPRMIAAGA